jgi:cell filamentation protein
VKSSVTDGARTRQEYFAAVRAGLDRNYEPMERIFSAVIRRTLRVSSSEEYD